MKKIKNFAKAHKWMVGFLIVSIAVVISYILTDDSQELFDGADLWYNLASQIGVGYIINFIFYLMQVYYPNKEKNRIFAERALKKEEDILQYMGRACNKMLKDKNIESTFESITVEQLKEIEDIRLEEKCGITRHHKYITYLDYIIENVHEVEKVIYELVNIYGASLSTQGFQILEEIRESSYHQEYKMQELSPAGRIKGSESQEQINGKHVIASDTLQINAINFIETMLEYSRLYNKLKNELGQIR